MGVFIFRIMVFWLYMGAPVLGIAGREKLRLLVWTFNPELCGWDPARSVSFVSIVDKGIVLHVRGHGQLQK